MKAFILFLIFATNGISLLALGDDDTFVPPSSALGSSKYVTDCGGVSEDIEADMPPVDDQMQSPWCATFASKSLLEYYLHQANPGDNYSSRLSAVDINSQNIDLSTDARGKFAGFKSGSNPFAILEGVQISGEIYKDQDYPFDQALFDKANVLDELSTYYDETKPYKDAGAIECYSDTDDDQSLKSLLTSVQDIAGTSADKNAFLVAVNNKYQTDVVPKVGAQRIPLVPPFSIRHVDASSGDQFMEELQHNLQAKRPTAVDICANQMLQVTNLSHGYVVPPNAANTCGGHAIVVVGMKKIGGKCEIEIHNSWGKSWPVSKGGGGTAWISASEFLGFLEMSKQGDTSLDSLTPRKLGDAAENELYRKDGTYVGETLKGDFMGKGTWKQTDGSVLSGVFEHNAIIKGTYKLSNGAVETGDFKNGRLFKGYYKGVIDETKGEYYYGPIVNGLTSTATGGKYTDATGQPYHGH